MNKIFFMTLFLIKWSRLILGLFFRLSKGPAFKCPGQVENDHSKAGMVWLSDGYCTVLFRFSNGSFKLEPGILISDHLKTGHI
jgi:hypothetical protein